jgi:hypothetical protein
VAEVNPTNSTLRQAATLVGGSILLLAASVLFIGAVIGKAEGAVMVTALLNAGLFYLWGMGCVGAVLRAWREATKRERPGPDA